VPMSSDPDPERLTSATRTLVSRRRFNTTVAAGSACWRSTSSAADLPLRATAGPIRTVEMSAELATRLARKQVSARRRTHTAQINAWIRRCAIMRSSPAGDGRGADETIVRRGPIEGAQACRWHRMCRYGGHSYDSWIAVLPRPCAVARRAHRDENSRGRRHHRG
jgi:hypothetical protein